MRAENVLSQGCVFEYIEGNITFCDDKNIHLSGDLGAFLKFRVLGKNFMIKIHKENLLQRLNVDHGKLFVYITSSSVAEKSFFTSTGTMLSNVDGVINDEYVYVYTTGNRVVINNDKEVYLTEEIPHEILVENGLKKYIFPIGEVIANSTNIVVDNHHLF